VFSFEVKNECSYTYTHFYTFMTWTGRTLYRGNRILLVTIIYDIANFWVG